MQKIGVWAGVFMSIGSKGTVIRELFSAVTIGLSFQTQAAVTPDRTPYTKLRNAVGVNRRETF